MERKRILRELFTTPEPWVISHRNCYRELTVAEHRYVMTSLAQLDTGSMSVISKGAPNGPVKLAAKFADVLRRRQLPDRRKS
jgi:hypothetical protein